MSRERNEPPLGGERKEKDDHEHNQHCGDHEDHHNGGKEPLWKLNVQGGVIESSHPEIVVRQAIKQAGFNPDTPWIIVLKVVGEPKREVDLSSVIDLRHKGIEKLRLTLKQINNGELAAGKRVEFAVLPQERLRCELTVAVVPNAGSHQHDLTSSEVTRTPEHEPAPPT